MLLCFDPLKWQEVQWYMIHSCAWAPTWCAQVCECPWGSGFRVSPSEPKGRWAPSWVLGGGGVLDCVLDWPSTSIYGTSLSASQCIRKHLQAERTLLVALSSPAEPLFHFPAACLAFPGSRHILTSRCPSPQNHTLMSKSTWMLWACIGHCWTGLVLLMSCYKIRAIQTSLTQMA